MRLVFAGTPEPAVKALEALLASRHEIVAVITRPDARSGRGRTMQASPVGALAEERGLKVLKPASPKDPDFQAELRELAPDAIPVVAYGALIPQSALDIPKYGWVNLHFSLLPAWRGAAPVQHSIWKGDDITGASTFLIEAGLDTGPVFGVVTQTIKPTDTSGTLLAELAESGAELLVRTMDALETGEVVGIPQPAEGISLAPKISVDDARIDWSEPAVGVDRRIRACTPAPGAWTTLRGERVKLGPVSPSAADLEELLAPGQIHVTKKAIYAGTATSPVQLSTAKAEGKKEMAAGDWARGLRLEQGETFE